MSTLNYADKQACIARIQAILKWLETNPQPGDIWPDGISSSLSFLTGTWQTDDEQNNPARLNKAMANENFLSVKRICSEALKELSYDNHANTQDVAPADPANTQDVAPADPANTQDVAPADPANTQDVAPAN